MSGICGVLELAGATPDRPMLDRLTASLSFRGPDGRGVRIVGAAGLGKTLLTTTPESAAEGGPCTVDGGNWIVADARIDARDDLRDRLAKRGRALPPHVTDEQLILHAYGAWGEECLGHLMGDFAFAIWDPSRGCMFCARDHFGIKPFYYALSRDRFAFSNTLAALRNELPLPGLDDEFIGDFLATGAALDPEATAFHGLRRLPSSHCIRVSAAGARTRAYWQLPRESVIRYRSAGDYSERLAELLKVAVSDRLRASRAGVLLSGGLDASALAATAASMQPRVELRAHTQDWNDAFPDDESRFAAAVAERLGMSIDYQHSGRYRLYERQREMPEFFTEPGNEPFAASDVDLARQAAAHARTTLTGWDADALLTESPRPYFRSLARGAQIPRLMGALLQYAWAERLTIPGRMIRAVSRKSSPVPGARMPPWIRADFAVRSGLADRVVTTSARFSHPMRPYAYRALDYLMRSNFFEASDPGRTGALVELRHPMLDLRVVEYCLSLPPYPWCVRKHALRRAMRNALPAVVLARPKTPLGGYPHLAALGRDESRWVDLFTPSEPLAKYVERDKIPKVWGSNDPDAAWVNLRPLSLDIWMRTAGAAL